jgi:hypothetical protein
VTIGNEKSASVALVDSLRCGFQADPVVYRIAEPLLAAKVPFCRLHTYMTKQELDLLKLPTRFMTQTRACTPRSCGATFSKPHFESGFHHAPDDLRTESAFPNSLPLIDGPKDRSCGDLGGIQPTVHCRFYSGRDWNCPHVPAFPN